MTRTSRFLLALCLTAAPAAQATTYLCFGDSITEGLGGADGDAYLGPLGAYLSATVGATAMINEGLGGEYTTPGLQRLRAILGVVQPEYVLLMEGTNDVYRWILRPEVIDPGRSESNLRDMVREARARGAIVVLATVVPELPGAIDPDNVQTRRLNDIIRRVAAEEGATLAEVFGNVEPEAGFFIYRDSIHPNGIGDALVAEAFAAAITRQDVASIDLTPPVPFLIEPAPFSTGNPLSSRIRIAVRERKHPIDPALATLAVDGVPVAPAITSLAAGETLFAHDFAEELAFGQRVRVEFRVADAATTPNNLVLDHDFVALAGNGSGGDIDRSGRVDGADLAILAGSFGTSGGEPRYRFDADIDGNGFIDGLDLMFLASRFGGPP